MSTRATAPLPLYDAAQCGREGIVRLLLKADATQYCKFEGGTTALLVAAQNGHGDALRVLCEAGGDVHFRRKDGETPLSRAVRRGHAACVAVLLDHGAKWDEVANEHGSTLPYAAAYHGHLDVVRVFIEKACVDVNVAAPKGSTMLMAACEQGQHSVAAYLLVRGATTKAKNVELGTALHMAALGNRPDIVDLLIRHGANVHATNNEGEDTARRDCGQAIRARGPDAAGGHDPCPCASSINHSDDVNLITHDLPLFLLAFWCVTN